MTPEELQKLPPEERAIAFYETIYRLQHPEKEIQETLIRICNELTINNQNKVLLQARRILAKQEEQRERRQCKKN